MVEFLILAVTCLLASVSCELKNETRTIVVVDNFTTYINYSEDFNCSDVEGGGFVLLWEINVVEEGLGVSVIFNKTFLDPDLGEHFILSADESMNGENASVTYLTGTQSNIRLAIPLVRKAFLKFSASNSSCYSGLEFLVALSQFEEATPVPAPTTPSPYPPGGIKTEIIIYLSGKTLSQFVDNEQLQRDFMAEIQQRAFNFSDRNGIRYDANKPANETVFLRRPQVCPKKWEDFETCVSVLLSVYVTEPRKDYELSVTHLEQLWNEIENDGLSIKLGVQPYEFPNVAYEILWWMLWILIAIVITGVLGYLFWKLEFNSNQVEALLIEEEERRRKEEIFRDVELRRKNPRQLQLSKHQKIPDFMLREDGISTPPTMRKKQLGVSTPPNTKKHLFMPNHKLPKTVLTLPTPPLPSPKPDDESPKPFFYKNAFMEEEESKL